MRKIKLDEWDKYFLVFLAAFTVISLAMIQTPPTPDEGTHSLIALFFRDLFSDLTRHPTISFSSIYNYTISYLVHYPKLSLYYPPLLHIIISFFYIVLGTSFFTGRLVVLLFALGTLAILYKLAKRFFGNKVALLSAILFSVMPLVFYDSITVMTDIPYTFFFLISMYLFLEAFESKQRKYFVLAAVFAALAFFTKWNAILIVPIIFAYALFRKRSQMKNVVLSAFLVFLIISPYLVVMWKTGLASIPFISSLQVSATAKQDPQFTTPQGWAYYLDALSTYYFTLPLFIASIIALIFYINDRGKYWELLVIWILAYYVFFTILSNKEPRYMMPLLPALLIPLSSFMVLQRKVLIPVLIISFALLFSSTWGLVSQAFYYNPDFQTVAVETLQSKGNVLLATEPSWFYSSQFIFTLASMDNNMSKFVYRSCSPISDKLFSDYGIKYVIVSEPTDRDIENMRLVESTSNLVFENKFTTSTTNVSLYNYNNYTPQKQYCNFVCVLNNTICTDYVNPSDALK
ncbi:glycosyltransferase family 39 protein [archaeon]|nr:MAG: glycosyltransferase family 39 protein [archaeon]